MLKKSLGQHWLQDQATLSKIVQAGEISKQDTVLEIGPGPGSLTELLVNKAKAVIAVEKDELLATDLQRKLGAAGLRVVSGDIMEFDLNQLPRGYKVVANIPYYLTSKLLRTLIESPNPPGSMTLLVQKEVAQRIVAPPGQMSLLAFSVQYYAQANIIGFVDRLLFNPPPKVDSAIIKIKRFPTPVFTAEPKLLFRVVKAGFSARRKQLKNALAAGLRLPASQTVTLLKKARISPQARAQELSLAEWQCLYEAMKAVI